MNSGAVRLFPSLLCGDLYNLEKSISELTAAGYDTVHVDILDGHFSPSMPLGLDSVAQMRRQATVKVDAHIMSTNNEFFVDEFIKMGCERICFHYETTPHIDYLVNKIRSAGIEAGIALKPATPVWALEEIAGSIDYVLLMLINPGYAGCKSEQRVPYACEKIRRCRDFLQGGGHDIPIEIDGRVSFDMLEAFIDAGASDIVGGTGVSFCRSGTIAENKRRFDEIMQDRKRRCVS